LILFRLPVFLYIEAYKIIIYQEILMRKNIFAAALIWTAIVAGSFFWNWHSSKERQFNLAMESGRSNFQQIVLFRFWNSMHGGVYVPVTESTEPNPYLKTDLKNIKVSSSLTLTMVNPAFMTRQVSEIAEEREGIKFRITSLNPLRPANRASDEERGALEEFESGLKEKGVIKRTGGMESFFYMAPLITEAPCLKCHAMQGYKEGEIRGGISVTLPYIPEIPFFMIIVSHLTALAAGLSGIIFSGVKLANAYSIIQRQAVFDALTGIPNRHSFTERLLSEYNRSQRDRYPLTVIMGDIDHFKLYNDTYGHAEGDECLVSVAKTIEKTLKRPGDFCARYGGEEFIIILPATDEKGAVRIADEIRDNIMALHIPHESSPDYKVVTISLGIGTKGDGKAITHEELLKMADDALYLAKAKGRNRSEVYCGKEG